MKGKSVCVYLYFAQHPKQYVALERLAPKGDVKKLILDIVTKLFA